LEDGDARGERDVFYGRKGNLVAATSRAVGLRDHGGDLKVGLGEEML